MNRNALLIIGAILLVGALLWYEHEGAAPPPAPRSPEPAAPSATAGASRAPAAPPVVMAPPARQPLPDVRPVQPPEIGPGGAISIASPAFTPAAPEPSPGESPGLQGATAVEAVRGAIRKFGSTLGGNPVGTNAEITAALNGDNPAHARFLEGIPGQQINANGELIDPWGTPYFFHQLSAQDMEVRSAGPDRTMYTADDIVIH